MKKLISVLLTVMLIFSAQAAFAYDLNQNADFEPQTIRDGLIISVPTYTMVKADGETAAAFTTLDGYGGATITAHIMAKDYKTASSAIYAIIALYDAQNNLIKTATANATLPATLGKEIEIQPAITLPDDLSNACYIKTMVWTDINSSLTPYVQSFTFPDGTVDSDWVLDGWEVVADKETSDNGVYTNEYSALKATKAGATASKTFKVEPVSTSVAVFMVKGDRTNGSVICNILGKDGSQLATYTIKDGDETISRFRDFFNYFTVPFNTGTNDEVTVQFVNGADCAAYVDDVSVTDNLIVNGDFDSNTVYGKWTPYWSLETGANLDTKGYTFSIDNSDKVEGKSSLKIETAKATTHLQQIVKKAVIDKAGTGTYVLSGYYKRSLTNSNGQNGTKFFPWVSQGSTFLVQYPKDIMDTYGSSADNTDWHYFSQEFNIDESSDLDLKLYFAGAAYEPSTIHVDDLRLVKKNNLLANGDAERGKTDWSMDQGSATVAADNSVAYAGINSIKVSGRIGATESLSQDIMTLLKNNGAGVYGFGGFIKSENGGVPVMNVRLSYKKAGETGNTLYDDDANKVYGTAGVTDWQYVTGTVAITQEMVDSLNWARLQMRTGTNKDAAVQVGDFYADNVRFYKISDLPAQEVTE